MGNRRNNIFKRYASGQATAIERKAINLFFDRLQENPKIDAGSLPDEKGDMLLASIESRISRRSAKPYWTIAASVAAVFMVCSILLTDVFSSDAGEMKTITALSGERKKIVLPDASIVYLNSGSSLTYPVAFGKKSREVILKGEGYFEVEHDTGHPFIITSDHLTTQVLGTKFIVSNYIDGAPAVTVVSGKVKVSDRGTSASTIITKGQRVVYQKTSASLIRQTDVDSRNYLAWKDGRMYFDHSDIRQVLQTLQRNYNLKIQLDSPLYQCQTISGNFPGDDIRKVLESIRFINGMEYSDVSADTIRITLKPCKNQLPMP